jgi:hypothetical protein
MAGVPWWMFCIGGFSFVVVVIGMIVWQVIQSRLEKQEEDAFAAGKGIAPPTVPEPLHAWLVMACGVVDGGASWTNEKPEAGQAMLGSSWGVNNATLLDHRLSELSAAERNAWNLVRAARLVLAAYAARYVDPAGCWNRVRPIAQILQQRYPSFDAIAHDYLIGLRAWKHLPPDGSGDDAEMQKHRGFAERLRGESWRGVPYSAAL